MVNNQNNMSLSNCLKWTRKLEEHNVFVDDVFPDYSSLFKNTFFPSALLFLYINEAGV